MIRVFSTRKDKPHHYKFLDMEAGSTDPNGVGFNPIEMSISKDGRDWTSIYDVPDLRNVLVADTPYVAEAKPDNHYQKIGINDGESLLYSSYEQRELKVTFVFDGLSRGDTELAFDALQRFLFTRQPYWICFANWPQRMYYVMTTSIKQTHLTDRGYVAEATFTDQVGLSRSVGSSGDWSKNGIIGFGNNEPLTTEEYYFTSSSFDVHNLSDVLIDPERRGQPFVMTMRGKSGGKMKVTNKTTNDVISRDKSFSGTFVLDGVEPYLDNKGDLLNTNYGVITLQPGVNHFQVENFSGTITFDFPFWWLS